ncbi:hypothetical protein HG535_0D04720 [Zygotorulaspora mrakii]|uniref:37S ribosomal protein PET123, mitochondrial n=1 Tax=Zygotorulaspora mrakii TaxID=42260 RepID=A0A7H9B2Q1_ZYGMR|nr:uncharacterized protein HG535_0D04720 [Zygotorulaspora mrakii]QLG72763.1 hypothetical protein HG535_0D04720 [Zygotorulaspora mrakii]
MGKGAAKHGFKSGVLPITRSILKKPTVLQESIVAKAKAPKPKGIDGVGYAEGVKHPKGSHREPSPVKFIDVEDLIAKTSAPPSSIRSVVSPQQEKKLRMAELRRKFLSEAFRNEESRLLKLEQTMKQRAQALQEEKSNELALLNESRSSDLTIPTLESIIKEPLMRQRTPEEKEVLAMKRKYNREMIQFKSNERKLEKLLELYHVSSEFIVTEEQLLEKIDEAFNNEGSDVLRTKLSLGTSRIRARNENKLGDALFGTIGDGEHVGLPTVKEYLNGEMKKFAEEVESRSIEALNQRKENNDNILQI